MAATAHLLINGTWRSGEGPVFQSIDPASGEVVWEGASAGPGEVDDAVRAARKAGPAWASRSFDKRFEFCERFKAILQEKKEEIALTISRETGKPLWESRGETGAMIGKIDLSVKSYHARCAELHSEQQGVTAITRHRPHGVVAVIGPFNFPAHLPNGHIVPALLAGNTIVFKPSEHTPSVAELMVAYWIKAGLPPGVLNLVQGGRETGELLTTHEGIDGVFFTGSAATGRKLSSYFGEHPEKILALELGGNNPLIVYQASDIEAAAYLTIQSAFITAGQRCTCCRRLILPKESKTDAFLASLCKMTQELKVGTYKDDPEPFIGPVISAKMAELLLQKQKELLASGGKSLVEMRLLKEGTGLVTPGIIDVTGVQNREDEEWFGPLLQVVRVGSFEKAMEEATRTRYGLSAGILTDSRENYEAFYSNSRAGIVNWNSQITGASGAAPFGGVGISGNHRPSAYYAADYCSFPVASMEKAKLELPTTLTPGITL